MMYIKDSDFKFERGIGMPKQIYIVEPDSSLINDIETMLLLKPDLEICGSASLLSKAEEDIRTNPAICCAVIAQSVFDADCLTAIKQIRKYNVAVVVMLNSDCPAETKTAIELIDGCYSVTKPVVISVLCDQIYKSIASLSPDSDTPKGPEPEELEKLTPVTPEAIPSDDDYSEAELADNPYINQLDDGDLSFSGASDLRERFYELGKNKKIKEEAERVIPQKVIALHNQKGGVGKSTIAIDLSVALASKITLVKFGAQYRPKVCLVDFDLDACDVAAMLYLNLDNHRNSGAFANDLKLEAKRRTAQKGKVEPIQNIMFSERDIKEKYLTVHESGVYILPAPTNKRDSTQIHQDEIKAIIRNLRACDFDLIIIDTGPNILDYTLSALIGADEVYAVSTCEITSIRRLATIINDLQGLSGYNSAKTKLVINKYDPLLTTKDMSPDNISDVLRCQIYGVIPQFNELPNIRNEGYTVFNSRLAVNENDLEQYTRAVINLAKRTLGVKSAAPEPTAPPVKKGFFGKFTDKIRKRKE